MFLYIVYTRTSVTVSTQNTFRITSLSDLGRLTHPCPNLLDLNMRGFRREQGVYFLLSAGHGNSAGVSHGGKVRGTSSEWTPQGSGRLQGKGDGRHPRNVKWTQR